jgi:cyclophilin family peptidyl-prolyl cis-trans isomerase
MLTLTFSGCYTDKVAQVNQEIESVQMNLDNKSKEIQKNIENKTQEVQKSVKEEINNSLPFTMKYEEDQIAVIKTNLGDIKVELFTTKAPKTVNNFLYLVQSDFYDQTKFHRIIKDFMIQAGDPLTKDENQMVYGTGGPGYIFEDEINNIKLVKGSLAMANSGPDTNGSQFFIVTAESTPWLVGKHTNFGKVIEGMDVVDKIEALETNERDYPTEEVIVESVDLIEMM